jgi:hypothetical protein
MRTETGDSVLALESVTTCVAQPATRTDDLKSHSSMLPYRLTKNASKVEAAGGLVMTRSTDTVIPQCSGLQ